VGVLVEEGLGCISSSIIATVANLTQTPTPAAAAMFSFLQAPAHLPASVGVLVEEGPGCFLVKVNCKDRHGLLSDITSAIRGLSLQVGQRCMVISL
jgi:hypothetical protein